MRVHCRPTSPPSVTFESNISAMETWEVFGSSGRSGPHTVPRACCSLDTVGAQALQASSGMLVNITLCYWLICWFFFPWGLGGKVGTSGKVTRLRRPLFDLSTSTCLLKVPLLAVGPKGPMRLITNSALIMFTLQCLGDVFDPADSWQSGVLAWHITNSWMTHRDNGRH